MKAKTKEQKRVVKYKFKRLQEKLVDQYGDQIFKFTYSVAWKWVYCHECGERFRSKEGLLKQEIDCPMCGKRLSFNNNYMETRYIAQTTVRDEYQVDRVFQINKCFGRGRPRDYWHKEVVRNFIRPEKTISMRVLGGGFFGNRYSGISLELRHFNSDAYVYPERVQVIKIQPKLRQLGYVGQDTELNITKTCELLYTNPKAEILLKTNQYSIFSYLGEYANKIDEHWDSIRIASRHKFLISDWNLYKDYLEDLILQGKDLRNPKYLCERNYIQIHNDFAAKRRELEIRERERQRELTKVNARKAFMKHIPLFIGLQFQKGNITIEPLPSLSQIYIEAKTHHHCVFQSSYYGNTERLYLSATVDGKRTETIELSLSTFAILQSRGLQNQPTAYHNEIIKLMNKNVPKIRKLVKEAERWEI